MHGLPLRRRTTPTTFGLQQGFATSGMGLGCILRSSNPRRRMSEEGHKRTFRPYSLDVRFTPKADIHRREQHARFVPKADIGSITSSAKIENDSAKVALSGRDAWGSSRPSKGPRAWAGMAETDQQNDLLGR